MEALQANIFEELFHWRTTHKCWSNSPWARGEYYWCLECTRLTEAVSHSNGWTPRTRKILHRENDNEILALDWIWMWCVQCGVISSLTWYEWNQCWIFLGHESRCRQIAGRDGHGGAGYDVHLAQERRSVRVSQHHALLPYQTTTYYIYVIVSDKDEWRSLMLPTPPSPDEMPSVNEQDMRMSLYSLWSLSAMIRRYWREIIRWNCRMMTTRTWILMWYVMYMCLFGNLCFCDSEVCGGQLTDMC